MGDDLTGSLVVIARSAIAGAGRSTGTRRQGAALGAGLLSLGAVAATAGYAIPASWPPAAVATLVVLFLAALVGIVAAVGAMARRWADPALRELASLAALGAAPANDEGMEASRRRMEMAFAVGRHGLFEIDLRDRSVGVSEGFAEILGADVHGGPRFHLDDVVDDTDWWRFRAVHGLIEAGLAQRASGDYRFVRADGGSLWLHCRFDVVERDGAGRAVRILVVATDVSDRKQREVRLERLALHDALTGLANRAGLLARPVGDASHGNALVLIDLDAFKSVNDRHGHVVGDAWLVEVADRLRQVVRRGDVVARIGGDEFAIAPVGRLDRGALEDLAGRIVASLGRPLQHDGHSIEGGATVGAAYMLRPSAVSPARLYAQADAALYRAKRSGRAQFAINDVDGAGRLADEQPEAG